MGERTVERIMADNVEGCWNKHRLKNFDSCRSCYYDQVDRYNQWAGHEKCWKAKCIVYVENAK